MFDVEVLNEFGVWVTDLSTGSRYRAEERGRFLVPRTIQVRVINPFGERVGL